MSSAERDRPSAGHSVPTTPGQALLHASFREGRGRRLGVAAGSRMLHQIAEALVPVAIGVTVDHAIAPHDASALVWCLAGITALFVVLTTSWRMGTRLSTSVFSHGEHSLRQLLAAKVLHPLHSGTGRGPGRVLSISTSDTRHTAGLSWVIIEQLSAFAALLTATVSLLLISWPLGVTVVVATAAFMAAMHLITTPLERRALHQQASAAEASHVAADLIAGLRVLKGVGAVDIASTRYHRVSRSSVDASMSMVRARALFNGVSLGLSGAFVAAIAWLSSSMAAHGTISVGQLITVVGLAQFIKDPMTTLAFLSAEVREKRAVAGRLAGLLAEDNDLDQGVEEQASMQLDGDGDRLVTILTQTNDGQSISLDVETGRVVGIVAGPSAARHLVELLAYRRPLARGELTVRGRDALDLGPEQLARQVFVSDQGAAVFSTSVRANLATDSVDKALVRASALDEVLEHLPHGLDSTIGEHGRTLSGGQRQRLLLGRALHQQQEFLVLHEPTSAVDSVTESRIAESLGRLQGRTMLLITTSPALLNICHDVIDLDSDTANLSHLTGTTSA